MHVSLMHEPTTYIRKLVVPKMGLVAFQQLHGQIAVLAVALLNEKEEMDISTDKHHNTRPER